MLVPTSSTPKPRKKRRPTIHTHRRAGRGCMARSPRQRSVGVSAPAAKKNSAGNRKLSASGRPACASVDLMVSIPIPVYRTRQVAHTTRIARSSVGKRARRRRQTPSGNETSHQKRLPTTASIG
eukprot:scaffold30305_cov62-Phaeocystis_antarctica.AAC.1